MATSLSPSPPAVSPSRNATPHARSPAALDRVRASTFDDLTELRAMLWSVQFRLGDRELAAAIEYVDQWMQQIERIERRRRT
jgi:hypothetical protein